MTGQKSRVEARSEPELDSTGSFAAQLDDYSLWRVPRKEPFWYTLPLISMAVYMVFSLPQLVRSRRGGQVASPVEA